MAGFDSTREKEKHEPVERADFSYTPGSDTNQQGVPMDTRPPYPAIVPGQSLTPQFTWRPANAGTPYYPTEPTGPQQPGQPPRTPPFYPPQNPGGPARPGYPPAGPGYPGRPGEGPTGPPHGQPPADLVDQAVAARLKAHEDAVKNRSWLNSAVHGITDFVTHTFSGNSNDSEKHLKQLQQQYDQAKQRGQNTDQLKTQIYNEIAKDQSAQKREDTDAGYGTELLKAAALFAPGKVGRVAAGGLFALDETNNITSGEGIAKLGLGFGKGFGLSTLYGKLGDMNMSVPMKGITLGFGQRLLDTSLTLGNYQDSKGNFSWQATEKNYGSLFNLQQLGTDAAVFTLAHGLYKGGNALSGDAIANNRLYGKLFTAGSFGLVSDAAGEAQRQISQEGHVSDWGAVAEHGIVGSVVNAAGAGVTGRMGLPTEASTPRPPEPTAPDHNDGEHTDPPPDVKRGGDQHDTPAESPAKAAVEDPDKLLAWRSDYVPPPEAIEQSKEYAQSNKLWDKLLPGFQNAGRNADFDANGKHDQPQRPSTVFDPANDPVLRATLEEAHQRFDQLQGKPAQLARALTDFANEKLRGTSGPQTRESEAALDAWYDRFNAEHAGQRVLMGEYIRQGKGVCSQQAMLTKILADDFGAKAAFVRGLGGRHAWTTFWVQGAERIYDPRWRAFGLDHGDDRVHRTLLLPRRDSNN